MEAERVEKIIAECIKNSGLGSLGRKDNDVAEPIRFLRQRELTHFQRFGEALRLLQDRLPSNNFYQYNPAFDK